MYSNTIAAIATAMSNSGIGIIRISGDDAINIIDKIFVPKKGNKKMIEVKSHTIHYGNIIYKNEIIDEVLVTIMKSPNTYTRENVVEINCHGGIIVLNKVLEIVIKSGAFPAQPGEFTKRAFLNGRIDLSQAEAVIDIINAKNNFALKSSVTQLRGIVSEKIKDLRSIVISNVAFIEASLDDPEHIDTDGYKEKILKDVCNIKKELRKIIDNFDNGRIQYEGIKTVILGKPNAGKSSLLNTLMGEDRAIVTSIAGTTRDTLEETINIKGITLNIIDTAGIRETEDLIEKIGVKKSRDMAKDADLIIYVVDGSVDLDENDYDIINMLKEKKAIVLLNKSDIKNVISVEELNKICKKDVISISATTRLGIDELEQKIKDMFYNKNISFNDEIFITNIRQKNSINEAYNSILNVENSINNHMPEDFYTIDLMDAYERLGTVIGEQIEDDLVDNIFSKFCMGK